MCVYGYCRISTKKQSIDRQKRNIREKYPDAYIIEESFTGTKIEGRKEFNKMLAVIKTGDKIVFDSVSRMSRDADAGIELYMSLYDKGVSLEFLREPYVNTETYKNALRNGIDTVGNEIADVYIKATNEVLMILAKQQIRQAFEQSEKEVNDLHKRTSEGIETARCAGKQIGQRQGAKLITKKSIEAKKQIQKHSKDFNGSLSDVDCIKLVGLARNTYYKYKGELKKETMQ